MGIVTSGLVGYWHYEQGVSGNTWSNIAPATTGSYNGTISGATLQADGVFFDSVDDNAALSNFNLSTYTIEFYFKRNDYGKVFQFDGSNGLSLAVDSSGIVGISRDWNYYSTSQTIDTAYHHMVITYTNSSVKLLIDGVQVWTYANIFNALGNLKVSPEFIGMKVVYFRLYDKVLSPSEVTQNYNSGTTIGLEESPTGQTFTKSFSDSITIGDNALLATYTQGGGEEPPPSGELPYSDVITGTGTEVDPFILYKADHLSSLAANLSSYFKLNSNIDATEYTHTVPLDFAGTFDGNGKKISNLTLPSGGTKGFIGKTASGGKIKNVGLENATLSGAGLYSALLVGYLVTGSSVDGCYVTGSVTGTGNQIGGVVGFNQGGTVSDCFNKARVSGVGTSRIGAIVGRGGNITNCYNTALITGTDGVTLGGINSEGTNVVSSYWDKEVSGVTTSTGGTGLTTTQMKTQSSYVGWNFTDIWGIESSKNDGYPYLKAFDIAVPPTGTTYTKSLSDSISFTELFTKISSRRKTLTDSISSSETITKLYQGYRSLNDIITQTDSLTKQFTAYKVLSDEALLSDIIFTSSSRLFTKLLMDTVGFSDSFQKQIANRLYNSVALSENMQKQSSMKFIDSLTSTDSISKRLSVAILDTVSTGDADKDYTGKTLSDSIPSVDSLAKRLQKVIFDNLVTDDQILMQGGNSVNLGDYITITDTIRKALVKYKSDSVTTTETESERVNKTLLDTLTQSDNLISTKGKVVLLTDSLFATESINKAIQRLQIDSATLTDSFSQQSEVSVRLYDVVVTTDSFSTYLPNVPEYREALQIPINISTVQTIYVIIAKRQEVEVDITQRYSLDVDL
jgi:hypothetical protein